MTADVGGLPQAKAHAQPILALPGGVVREHLDVLAVTVGNGHLQPLPRRPAVAGIQHLEGHGPGSARHLGATRLIQRELVERAMGSQRYGLVGRGRGHGANQHRGQDSQGRKAHADTPAAAVVQR